MIEPLLKSGEFVPVLQTGVFVNGQAQPPRGLPDVPLRDRALDGKISGPARRAFESWLRTVQIGKYYALAAGHAGALPSRLIAMRSI